MPKISIIVPVYNAEKTLGRCVDSILNQPFKDFELILVDDGSKDRSPIICDSYAGIWQSGGVKPQIRVFHKENGGVSSARNMGLDEAQGEWVMFVDSDDELLPQFLTEGITECDSDIVIFSYVHIKGTEKNNRVLEKACLTPQKYAEQQLGGIFFSSPWAKLVKRSTIGNLRFQEGMRFSEDAVFNMQILRQARKVTTSDKLAYRYSEPADGCYPEKYMISVDESAKYLRLIFDSYDDLGVNSSTYEKGVFEYFKYMTSKAIEANPQEWYRHPYIKEVYKRVKSYYGSMFMVKYYLGQSKFLFKLNSILHKYHNR